MVPWLVCSHLSTVVRDVCVLQIVLSAQTWQWCINMCLWLQLRFSFFAEEYQQSLIKAFCRTAEEGRFSFIILDAPNIKNADFKDCLAAGQVTDWLFFSEMKGRVRKSAWLDAQVPALCKSATSGFALVHTFQCYFIAVLQQTFVFIPVVWAFFNTFSFVLHLPRQGFCA